MVRTNVCLHAIRIIYFRLKNDETIFVGLFIWHLSDNRGKV